MSRAIPTGLWTSDPSRWDDDDRSDEYRSDERVGLAGLAFAALRAPLDCRWGHAWILLTEEELAASAEKYGLTIAAPRNAVVNMPYPFPRARKDPKC